MLLPKSVFFIFSIFSISAPCASIAASHEEPSQDYPRIIVGEMPEIWSHQIECALLNEVVVFVSPEAEAHGKEKGSKANWKVKAGSRIGRTLFLAQSDH